MANGSASQYSAWAVTSFDVSQVAGAVSGVIGAANAGWDLYQKVSFHKYEKRKRKKEVEKVKAEIELVRAHRDYLQAVGTAYTNLGKGLTESANTEQLILHVLSS